MAGLRNSLLTALLLVLPGPASAQPAAPQSAAILKEPAGWRFERLPTPPPFAPAVKLSGFEEARFAPGMFDPTSDTYFTYALVFVADGAPALDRAALTDLLEKYFRGLSVGVGRQKGLNPDPAQMSADVAPAQSPDRYTAKVVFLDSFSDGRRIVLNVEAHSISPPGSGKTYLTVLISTQPKDAGIWRTLREVESNLRFPQP